MKLEERKGNLFEVGEKYHLAHCVSSDVEMGQGIAVDFQKNFNLRKKLLNFNEFERKYPICIQIGKVFNLITKNKYWDNPSYQSFRDSLEIAKKLIIENNVRHLAMPKMGCGLDRLEWVLVREIIKDVFKDVEIEILVMYL